MNMSAANIFAAVIFGSIGFAAFIYEKKQSNLKALVLGVILMGYPYFVRDPTALYATGVILTLLLFVPFGG